VLLSNKGITLSRLLGILGLLKPVSSFFIGLASFAAFCGASPRDPRPGWWLLLGICFLAGGCSAVNQWQESDLDALMARTRGRPLPSGRVGRGFALCLGLFFFVAGLSILCLKQPWIVTAMGLAGATWYNLIYTPLKARNGLAAFPGTLPGCLLPMLGWEAAGKIPDAVPALLVLGFSGLWQIVHVALLCIWWEEDHENSPNPNLYKALGYRGVTLLAATGMIGTGGLAVVLQLNDLMKSQAGAAIFRGFSLALLIMGFAVLFEKPSSEARRGIFIAWHLWLGVGLLLVIFGYFSEPHG